MAPTNKQPPIPTKCYLYLEPAFNDLTNRLKAVKVTKVTQQKPVPGGQSTVSPGTVILEVLMNIDPSVFDYPQLVFDLEASQMKPDAIVRELKEWTGAK